MGEQGPAPLQCSLLRKIHISEFGCFYWHNCYLNEVRISATKLICFLRFWNSSLLYQIKHKIRWGGAGSILLLCSTITAVRRWKKPISREVAGLPWSYLEAWHIQPIQDRLCCILWILHSGRKNSCHHYVSTLPMAELSSRVITPMQQKLQQKGQGNFSS